jgi:hypothetical protein
MATVCQ